MDCAEEVQLLRGVLRELVGELVVEDAEGRVIYALPSAATPAPPCADSSALHSLAEQRASLRRLVAGLAEELSDPAQYLRENIRVLREALDDMLPLIEQQWRRAPELRIARLPFPFFRRQIPVLARDMESGAARILAVVASLESLTLDPTPGDERVDMGEVLRAAHRRVRGQLERVAEVRLEWEEPLPGVRGDREQLVQVLMALLVNAAQAIEGQLRHGHPHRRGLITARMHDRPGRLHLEITDDGPGIPPGALRRVFDPFYTTGEKHRRTGLGLFFAQRVVQAHQGRLRVVSSVGEGTTFTLELPTLPQERA